MNGRVDPKRQGEPSHARDGASTLESRLAG